MTLEIRPCRNTPEGGVEETDAKQAEFWGLYRRGDEEPKLAFHLQDFPTPAAASEGMQYEFRCEAFQAQGLSRADAQARVDAEKAEPALRKTAHGLPQHLADSGYRIEFGDENAEELRGKWWWTFSHDGDVESSEAEFQTAEDAVADALADYEAGGDISSEAWQAAQSYFGLDPSFQYSPEQMREHIASLPAALEGEEDCRDLLREALEHEGALVTWFTDFSRRAKSALGITEGA
jgi:hypothetical protein